MYDTLDNVKEIYYIINNTETLAFSYEYTAKGQLYRVTDEREGTVTTYRYDDNDRLTSTIQYGTGDYQNEFSSEVYYNDKGQLSSVYYKLNHPTDEMLSAYSLSYHYAYDTESRVTQTSISFGNSPYTFSNTYDDFGRLSSQGRSYSSFTGSKTYTYLTKTVSNTTYATGLVSSLVNTMGNTTNTYAYTYDSKGNITEFRLNGTLRAEYTYDDLGQLTQEIRYETDQQVTTDYQYDNAGNIVTVVKTTLEYGNYRGGDADEDADRLIPDIPTPVVTTTYYTYGDSVWGDKLTSYDGHTITYDAIGNPLSYYNGSSYTFTWEGRRLKTAQKGSTSLSFVYNDDALRTEKTVGSVTHHYYYSGSQLIAEEWNSNIILFLYDHDGTPVGMRYHKSTDNEDVWSIYWYETNLQGDVVAVYSSTGTKLVTYTYGAWGETSASYSNGGGSTGAYYNPLRYRGYYYDTETNLYYLQSRYYDPAICRFINADSALYHTMLGYNMFAYCNNNPVMGYDPSGREWWHWAIGAAIVVACAIAVVATAGGAAAGLAAVAAVANGMAATTTASTVAAGAFIGASVLYGGSAISAAITSNSFEEFNEQGNWGTVIVTGLGAVGGGGFAYASVASSLSTTTKSNSSSIQNDIIGLPRTGSALKNDSYHAFPDIVDNYAGDATKFSINNGSLYQLEGSLNGTSGRFEWIIQNGEVTHRFFVEGGGINGIPILP